MTKFIYFLLMLHISVLLVSGLLIFGTKSYFSVPVVHWSTATGDCVRVIHDGIELDCSNMPDEYERVWVE